MLAVVVVVVVGCWNEEQLVVVVEQLDDRSEDDWLWNVFAVVVLLSFRLSMLLEQPDLLLTTRERCL